MQGLEVKSKFVDKKRSGQDSSLGVRSFAKADEKDQEYTLPSYGKITLKKPEKRPMEDDDYPDGSKLQKKIVLRKSEKKGIG